MSLNDGWCSLKDAVKAYRNALALFIMVGGIVVAAEDRYLPADTDKFVVASEFEAKFDELGEGLDSMQDQMSELSISMYESQLIQTELAIGELESRDDRSFQDQRRLEELRIKRRNLRNKLNVLRNQP